LVDKTLRCLTGPIDIDYDGITYEFGCFWLDLPLGKGRLVIAPETRDQVVDDYAHPHLATDGTPCLGNINSSVAQLRGEGKLFDCVALLLEFLRSYNPDNPYLRIERWDPDWEDDDDKFENCYAAATLSDCASCSDWDCPHRDGAGRRCYEHADVQDCVDCAECGLREDAVRSCRENSSPQECVPCGSSCPWAGNARLCREAHDGEECAGCAHTECQHYEREEEAAVAA